MRCPITYQQVDSGKYSIVGLHSLSSKLNSLNDIPLSLSEIHQEYLSRAGKMSIQGVQPKLSMKLNIKENQFEIVDIKGKFILKPPNELYPELPQNEDLSMKMAKICNIEVPWHGLIYSKDNILNYAIRRFDRKGHNNKFALEDFAQLSNATRNTKYNSSMEQIVSIIDEFCTFPILEKIKLFRRILFNFLIGNEDMHLKNFSLITRNRKVELSPAYDLLNTTIALPNLIEEIALPIGGKKNKINHHDVIDYLGKERMKIPSKKIEEEIERIFSCYLEWEKLIEISFLSETMKEKYNILVQDRKKRIFG
ncbi:MAG: type II toxin-antitoxin system HipA family toxin [Candidatus Cloacimonadota bacterium]|nr:MAG: type II toxin-antitoxin system HipA family toxin [Candidatus Cloacimonadota bacterium]